MCEAGAGGAGDASRPGPGLSRPETDELLRRVLEYARETIWVRDARTLDAVYAGTGLQDELGVPAETAASVETFLTIVHPDDREALLAGYAAARAGEEALVEFRVQTPDRGLRWLHTRMFPLWEAGGGVRHIAGISEDATDRRAAEEAERRRQEEISRAMGRTAVEGTAAGLAHELSQPLFVIANYARETLRRLQEGRESAAGVAEALARIAEEADRSTELVRRLRDLARGRPLQTGREDLNDLVAEAVRVARRDAPPARPAIELDTAPDLPPVEADRIQLQQVVLNLVRNAIEAVAGTDGPRHVRVLTGGGPDGAWVSVRDSGPGFGPEVERRLFDPLYSTKAEGMGLGLAISRRIVEAHGGRLTAESLRPQGAAFTFHLPVAPPDGN
jgi:two-component system sensor kinase FixL